MVVKAGLGVLSAMLELDREVLCGRATSTAITERAARAKRNERTSDGRSAERGSACAAPMGESCRSRRGSTLPATIRKLIGQRIWMIIPVTAFSACVVQIMVRINGLPVHSPEQG